MRVIWLGIIVWRVWLCRRVLFVVFIIILFMVSVVIVVIDDINC